MPKNAKDAQVPLADQSKSQRFDIFSVPDVHSVAREEGKPAWDGLVPMEKAASLSPPLDAKGDSPSPTDERGQKGLSSGKTGGYIYHIFKTVHSLLGHLAEESHVSPV